MSMVRQWSVREAEVWDWIIDIVVSFRWIRGWVVVCVWLAVVVVRLVCVRDLCLQDGRGVCGEEVCCCSCCVAPSVAVLSPSRLPTSSTPPSILTGGTTNYLITRHVQAPFVVSRDTELVNS
jgi:hypothetical protein